MAGIVKEIDGQKKIVVFANKNSIEIQISNNNYSGFTRSEVTIEYTKTTD